MASGCPFGGASASPPLGETSPRPLQQANRHEEVANPKLPTGRARIRLLYEEYVRLPQLREVWDRPQTDRPVLEPLFAAGCHGIELCLLLLSEFVADPRTYVCKRPRIELVADDIAAQCRLLVEVVDAELEEELMAGAPKASRLSLTQPFPFEGCPPTKAAGEACHSPGLQRLTDAIGAALPGMRVAERNSLIRVVINITAAFAGFERWSVGLGLEPQLNVLRAAVGLPELQWPHRLSLDYDALVQPWRCLHTLTGEAFSNPEDWFFRTIHLGTDCWAFTALRRMGSSLDCAKAGAWHVAAARATQAARILDYCGQHVMLLTSMNLRDYLMLKVELEGTSGEGSVQVKAFKPTATALFEPLAAAVLGGAGNGEAGAAGLQGKEREAALLEALSRVYEHPDQHAELYAYCKALEALETGVLGGFYYRHYAVATHVIGSGARGTMGRAVQALRAGYEVPLFPLLDACRVGLGARIDAEQAERKGRVMTAILERHLAKEKGQQKGPQKQPGEQHSGSAAGSTLASAAPPRASAPSGCPFGQASAAQAALPVQEQASPAEGGLEVARARLYSWQEVPATFRDMVAAEAAQQAQALGLPPRPALPGPRADPLAGTPLSFLDHAWGTVLPLAQYRAWREAAGLCQLGNPAWDAMFERVLPQACANVKRLLGLDPSSSACSVHWGHNSHELVARLLSALVDRRASQRPLAGSAGAAGAGGSPGACLRVLCSDTEFYSAVRQLNRLAEAGLVEVEVVAAQPAAAFSERCAAAVAAACTAGRPFDVVYVSQATFLTQQTLVPDIPAFVARLRAAEGGSSAAQVVVDAYHGFCALPTRLGEAAGECCYVAGLLKHAGCGPNAAFMTLPARLAATLRPLHTGWIADPAVLAPGSGGVQIGSEVGYSPGLALQGGTPAYLLPLLTFNHLMELWREVRPALWVDALHAHVMALHRTLLAGLDAAGHPVLNSRTLVPPQDEACRSHTLVFRPPIKADAQAAVEALRQRGILVDSRQGHVRVGLGASHSAADVVALLGALRACAAA